MHFSMENLMISLSCLMGSEQLLIVSELESRIGYLISVEQLNGDLIIKVLTFECKLLILLFELQE